MERYQAWQRFWTREVELEPGRFYFLRLAGTELPVIARLNGWNDEIPVFEFLDDFVPGTATVSILGEARNPYRERDAGDPPIA